MREYALYDLGYRPEGTRTGYTYLEEALQNIFRKPHSPLLRIDGHSKVVVQTQRNGGSTRIAMDMEDAVLFGEEQNHLTIHPLRLPKGIDAGGPAVVVNASPAKLELAVDDDHITITHPPGTGMYMHAPIPRSDADRQVWELLASDLKLDTSWQQPGLGKQPYLQCTIHDATVKMGRAKHGYLIAVEFPTPPSQDLIERLTRKLDVRIVADTPKIIYDPKGERHTLRVSMAQSATAAEYLRRLIRPQQQSLFDPGKEERKGAEDRLT